MKRIGVMSTAAMFLLFGIPASANARQEKQEEKAKPAQQQAAKPQREPQEAKAPKQQQQARPETKQQAKAPKQEEQAKPEKQEQARAPKPQQEAKPEKQPQQAKVQTENNPAKPRQQAKGQQQQPRQQQARSSKAPERTQQAMARQRSQPALRLSARGSGRIPDERFHSNFGREHAFHMGNPVLVGGYSRFQYGGFWFGFVEPWPAGWYYTDDVYIDYVDGDYYMYNPYYPDTRFAINVVI
jgi:hypothetical protein